MERKLLNKITLNCPKCDCQDFSFKDERIYVKCNSCEKEYFGGVKEIISDLKLSNIKEINDFAKIETEKAFKKTFRGNKSIKIK